MDFDSCFVDCCKSCNSATNKYRSPVSGQGDCKCSGDVRVENFWGNEEKGKKLKVKTVREKDGLELKGDKRKKVTEMSCNCFKKNNKKPECKLKHEAEQMGRNEPVIFENCSNAWNNFITNSWKSKMERFYVSEERKYSNHSNSEKLLTENVLELEEKVDFLLRLFKVCSHKPSTDSHVDTMKGTWGDAWHWFNLNKRLCAAEEGIEKLALILQELLKEWTKKKTFFVADDCISHGEPLEEMTMGQRMNFLKNRNDILLSLIKTFLKSSSVEDVCSRLSSPSNDYEAKPVQVSSKLLYGGKNSSQDITREELMETLKNLQVSEPQQGKKNSHCSTRPPKREHGLNYPPNKLEVISEQAELGLNEEEEGDELENFPRLSVVRNLKGKFSQVSDEGSYDLTSRLLAQEAMLKSSLDKVHLELLSKLDSPEKNHLKSSLNVMNGTQAPPKEENNEFNFETGFDSLSDISCVFCENENCDKSTPSDTSRNTKRSRHEDPNKEEKSSSRGKDSSAKKINESQIKTKRNVKTPHKAVRAASGSVQKPAQSNNYCSASLCFSSREERQQNSTVQKPRPLTAPVYRRKNLPAAVPKVPAPEKSTRKNSGINSNVTNKNKILLSKKSFVQTP